MDQLLSGQFHNSAATIWYFAIETSGGFGPVASKILRDLAHQIKDVSKEPHSRAYLFQKNFCCGAERQCIICHGVCWFRFRCNVITIILYLY